MPDSANKIAADRSWTKSVRRAVVKIGSRVLVDDRNLPDETHIASLVEQMAQLHQNGVELICVSSGAVAAGMSDLDLAERPDDLPSLQAAAAVGQARLIELYRRLFAAHGVTTAQVLLTHPDLRSRERHLNARHTLSRLLEAGVVPIVNENDTVSVEEIRFGDNDRLSALTACLVHADVLVLLTSADGLLTAAPERDGELVPQVASVTEETRKYVDDTSSDISTGGMRTKLEAAEIVTGAGERAIIANGRATDVLTRLFAGESIGTYFAPSPLRLAGRKRWIAFFDHPRGDLHVDAGAAAALTQRGGSLLPVGVTKIEGEFDRGEPVRIIGPEGTEIARGLSNYSHSDVAQIAGVQSDKVDSILGRCEYVEIVHRNNLVLA